MTWKKIEIRDNPTHLYCAGLFEGEGSITSYLKKGKAKMYPTIQFVVDMTDIEPLDLFEDIMQVGKIYGPYYRLSDRQYKAKGIYRYQIGKLAEIKHTVSAIYDWLSPRRKEQCDTAINNYEQWELEFPRLHKRRDGVS
jgi:hypothetical protein